MTSHTVAQFISGNT